MSDDVETLRDLIEEARENGFRDVADTMDMMWPKDDPFAVPIPEQPVSGDRASVFRAGMIIAFEHTKAENGVDSPDFREAYVVSLRQNEKRRLADAFEYAWANSDRLFSDDFEYTELPLELDSAFVFGVALSFGYAYVRTEKS